MGKNKTTVSTEHPPLFSIRTLSKVAIFAMLTKFSLVMMEKEAGMWYWFMTNWGHLMVNFYFFLASICAVFKVSKTGTLHNIKDTIHHVACAQQFNIFFFYWIVLSYMDYTRIMGYKDLAHSQYHHFVSLSRHMLDPLLVWIPILNKRIYFRGSNIKLLLTISVVYAAWNYHGCQVLGRPIYPPIDWKSLSSVIFMVTGTGLTIGGFYMAKKIGA